MGSLFDYENHTDKADICYFNYENMEPGRVWQWEENETTGFFNVATNFKHLFDEPGHELIVGFQYTKGWENEKYKLSEN